MVVKYLRLNQYSIIVHQFPHTVHQLLAMQAMEPRRPVIGSHEQDQQDRLNQLMIWISQKMRIVLFGVMILEPENQVARQWLLKRPMTIVDDLNQKMQHVREFHHVVQHQRRHIEQTKLFDRGFSLDALQ